MGENHGLMWIMIAGLAVVVGTYSLSVSTNQSLDHTSEKLEAMVQGVFAGEG